MAFGKNAVSITDGSASVATRSFVRSSITPLRCTVADETVYDFSDIRAEKRVVVSITVEMARVILQLC